MSAESKSLPDRTLIAIASLVAFFVDHTDAGAISETNSLSVNRRRIIVCSTTGHTWHGLDVDNMNCEAGRDGFVNIFCSR